MLRVLHTGDIHLGDLNGPTKDGQNLRRLDTLACMEAIVEKARQEGPHLTIIAGDLFNRSRVWADTALEDVNDALERFIRPLCEYSEAVVLLFGTENHDNPNAFEVLKKSTGDLRNLHIYTTPQVDKINTSESKVQIMAVPGFDKSRIRLFCPGIDKEQENRNATALINDVVLGLSTQLDRSIPAIMVAHYTVAGASSETGSTFMAGQDVVITPATIDATGVNLACFGHIHHPQKLPCTTPAYYCGCPNQLTFNDEGTPHGFYIHELHDNVGVHSDFIRTPEREHKTFTMKEADVAAFIQTGELQTAEDFTGKIVRVRYSCTAEQDKAFNRAELQKKIMQAGAFHVAEVLPDDIGDMDAKADMNEHDTPAEALARWLELNDVPEATKARLLELAAPIIKAADDGRDADKHTGAFTPELIEVKNYRSYTEAAFDFSPVHMAMVNGQNGVGKSSLFMDAIADCLYEQTRAEDIGGWVRDGTKSGAITFTFGMGGARYRVIRTRTKAGRGTLALHRFNADTEAWENESDTTMKLTQAKIEHLLGMDCNTFCSIALIRQDAYGLFLEADSDRRMEVLSALLGLDIYTRMEEIARSNATEQRRKIAATKERISILGEQVKEKDTLEAEDQELQEKLASAQETIDGIDKIIAEQEAAEAMRNEIVAQANAKDAEALAYGKQAGEKADRAAALEKERDAAKLLAGQGQAAVDAYAAVKNARLELEHLAPKQAEYAALEQEIKNASESAREAAGRLETIQRDKDTTAELLADKANIEAAQAQLAELAPKQAEAKARIEKAVALARKLSDARRAVHEFLADSRAAIGAIETALQNARDEAARLDKSGCPVPDTASCTFMASAATAKKRVPELEKELAERKADDKAEYEKLKAAEATVQAEADAIGDPYGELKRLDILAADYQKTADKAPALAAAEARLAEIEKSYQEAQATAEDIGARLAAADMERRALEPAIARIKELNEQIERNESMADMLGEIRAAAAKVDALTPQVDELYRETNELLMKQREARAEADRIRERIPTRSGDLDTYRRMREAQQKTVTDCATQRGVVRAKKEAIARAEEQITGLRGEVEQIAAVLNDYTTLVQAFGLDGIQYMIIRGVVPEIMRQSNDILASMTGGRMAVDFRTEKEQKSTKQIVNSLEVWISSIQGTVRPYLSHSGGEKVKIALAVTLGLADVKARRAGVQLGMLFIDEPPFLDADGTDAYADALTNMAARNPGMRILAISHDPTMKARFTQNIVVTAGEDGSTVTME